ncbi:MAG: hypothetical protein MUE63_03300 [Xanthomonadales bacterium]|nr:hypothetical protein [Xanthomonadales bacterium]
MLSCAACLAISTAAPAQASPDADTREVSNYRLSQSGLARYSQAAGNLGRLGEALGSGCEEDDTSEQDDSIDGMVAKVNAIPGAEEAIESAGMPVREFVVFQFAVFQAGLAAWALDQPGGQLTPGASMENVEFFRANQAEFQQAAAQLPRDDCDQSGYDEEGYDEEHYDEAGPDDGYEE